MSSARFRNLICAALAFGLTAILPVQRSLGGVVEGTALPGAIPVDAGLLTQGVGQVITWDGSNGIAVNSFVGAERFYIEGIWGQATVSANVEAGKIWNGHEITSTLSDYYVAPEASGEFDWHATAVGSVLAGFDPNEDPYNYPYYKMGMAPLTQLSSGAIASGWYNDAAGESVYFNTTPKAFYSAYNYYFTKTWTHSYDLAPGISSQFFGPTDVINSSWGYEDAPGQDSLTKAADGMARANPKTTFVVAAGNSNTAANPTNNVGGPASGYNSISVGAVGNGTFDQFNAVADFSSRGPQDYFDPVHGLIAGVRAPVDLVAPGTSIVAAYYGGQTGGNGTGLSTTQPDTTGTANNYYSLGVAGTSFAAPIVSGAVSLLKSVSYLGWGMDEESRDTRVIKSVLMNSATKLPGWDNGQHPDSNGVIITTQSLDWAQGAGLLNLDSAFDQYYSGTKDVPGTGGGDITPAGWDYGAIQISSVQGQTSHNDYPIHFTLQATAVMDVTLSWFRNLGSPVFTDNPDPDLQTLVTEDLGFANLNLEIWNADFTQLYATSMSQYNNVELLHFTLPVSGEYAIRVTYDSQVFGAPVEESYGLAWNTDSSGIGINVIPEPGVTVLCCVAGLVFAVFARRQKARA